MNWPEWLQVGALVGLVLVVALGVFPGPVLHVLESPVQRIVDAVNASGGLTGLALPW